MCSGRFRLAQTTDVCHVCAGKGVSSSAALEVSVMSAVAAAHDIKLGGREVALLCQKVEVGYKH
jgi:galactokinase